MLQLAAMLDPNGVPGGVLVRSHAPAHLTEHRPRTAGSTGPSHQVRPEETILALRVLHRLSLIKHTPATENQAVRVHQLIQRATREGLPPDQHDDLARTAGDALVSVWPEAERDSARAQIPRSNTDALLAYAPGPLWSPGALFLFCVANWSAGGLGCAVDPGLRREAGGVGRMAVRLVAQTRSA